MSIAADVFVVGDVSTEMASEIREACAAVGISPGLKSLPTRRSLGGLEWLALIALPLQPFLTKLLQDAADDAYSWLKRFVRRILGHATGEHAASHALVLQDTDTGLHVVLDDDLDAEAYQELVHLDLPALAATRERGDLAFDRSQRRWRVTTDDGFSLHTPGRPHLDTPDVGGAGEHKEHSG